MAQRGVVCRSSTERNSFLLQASTVVERFGCCCELTALASPVLTYYWNLGVNCRPDNDGVWHVAALEFVAMARVRFHFAAKHSFVGLSGYDPVWAKAPVGCSSSLLLVDVFACIITALRSLSLFFTCSWPSLTVSIETQQKLLGLLRVPFLPGSSTIFVTVE